MDYPSKRQKMSKASSPQTHSSSGSRTNEGLSGSAVGTRSKDDGDLRRTIREHSPGVAELRKRLEENSIAKRQNDADVPNRQRPRLQRRNAEPDIVPRAPDTTVIASIVNVIIDEGSTAVAAITLTNPVGTNTVSVSDIGVVTIPPLTDIPTTITTVVTSETGAPSTPAVPPGISTDQTVISPPPTPPASPSSTTDSGSVTSAPAETTPAVSAHLKNETISTFTSIGSHTTITGTTVIDLSSLSSNRNITPHTSTKHTTFATSIRISHLGSGAAPSTDFSAASGTGVGSQPGATTGIGGGAAGTAVASGSGSAASTTAAGGSGGSNSNSGPPTPTLVGGVVGGVAGLAVLLLILLVLLRWWRRKTRPESVMETARSAQLPPAPTTRAMTQSPASHTPLMAALSPAFLNRWRNSGITASSASATVAPQERGFQKVAGRKIDSVLTTGGDGYGGEPSVFSKETAAGSSIAPPIPLADTSFYRDSQGFYGGPGRVPTPSPRPSTQDPVPRIPLHDPMPDNRESALTQTSTYLHDDASDDGVAVMRPSPARTPVPSSPGVSTTAFPHPPRTTETSTPPVSLRGPGALGRDPLGRSHPSFDGSRGSRFTESV